MVETLPDGRAVALFSGWMLLHRPLELRKDGRPVRLQELPLRILELLVSRPGELVTREELVTRLWPKGVVDFDAGLNTAMRKLRTVLGDDADAPRYIETIPRQGYRFIGVLDEGAPQDRPVDVLPPSDGIRSVLPTFRGRRGWRPRLLAACLLGAVMLLAVVLLSDRQEGRQRRTAPAHFRIAVLPFENLSPDPANAFFAEGMHAEILSTLTNRAPRLEVVSRMTMKSYKGPSQDLKQIARDLGVTHVLEGSVFRDGERVRITTALVDPRTDRQLWAQSFDKDLQSAISLQSDVASEVARQLAIELPTASAQLPPPKNLQAYDLWLKGTLEWQNAASVLGVSLDELFRIEALYTRAIEIDPTFAAAYAERSRVRGYKFAMGYDVGHANVESARADVAQARKLAGNVPLVLVREATLVSTVEGDIARGVALIARAEAAGPLSGDLLMFKAVLLGKAGRIEDSLRTFEEAARLDPANPAIMALWQASLFAARRPREALRVSAEFDRHFPGRINRGELLFAFTGSTARWRAEGDLLRAAQPLSTLSMENDLLRFEGRPDALGELLSRTTQQRFRQHFTFGPVAGLPARPVAELRGWYALLVGDRAGAAREGDEMLLFVRDATPTPWSAWWSRLLEAEARLFRGDRSGALANAHEALALADQMSTGAPRLFAKALGARVLAWSGAEDEAVSVLENLSTSFPSLGPALIVRDPLFSLPLANHPRYVQLKDRLEAEIARNQSLL